MARSLYRSGGNILRVPVDPPGYRGMAWAAATTCPAGDCNGRLWRGPEICCPSWTVGDASFYLAPIDGVTSSIYTPLHLTVMDMSGIVDCPPCGPGADELNGVGGATRALLTQTFGNRHRWQGTWVGPTKTWGWDLFISVGQVMNAYAGEWGGMTVFKYISAAGVDFDPRWGPTWTSEYVVGGCCAFGQGGHSGTMTLATGDLT